jgi:hypothetical protein
VGCGPAAAAGAGLDASRPAASAALKRDEAVDFVEVPGADHFDLIDPAHRVWRGAVDSPTFSVPGEC